jgi:hypothetical protein
MAFQRDGNLYLNRGIREDRGMKKLLVAAVAACALVFAATAAATLEPGVFDPTNSGCVSATYSHGVLHLVKNCTAGTPQFNSAAGADITGLDGQAFQSASFTLASASQCLGGSPRFDVSTTTGLFFLGCNNVTPTTNSDGSVTYSFTPANLIPADSSNTAAPGTITGLSLLIDQNGTADVTKIIVNGVLQKPLPKGLTAKKQCMKGGWKTSTSPKFKNQGQCIAYWNHVLRDARKAEQKSKKGH